MVVKQPQGFRVRRISPVLSVHIPPIAKAVDGSATIGKTNSEKDKGLWNKINTLTNVNEVFNGSQHTVYIKYRNGTVVALRPCNNLGQCKGIIRFVTGFKSGVYGAQYLHEDTEDYGGLSGFDNCLNRRYSRESMEQFNGKQNDAPKAVRKGRTVTPHVGNLSNNNVYGDLNGEYEFCSYLDYSETLLHGEYGNYLPEMDVCIASSPEIIRQCIHPSSTLGRRLQDDFKRDENKLTVGMYIVDNHNRFQERYTTLAGETFIIPCFSDNSQIEGFYINRPTFTTIEGGKPYPSYYTIEDAEKAGIIRTKKEEITNDARLEEMRIRNEKHEFEKQYADEKLKLEREKMHHDKENKDGVRRESWISNCFKILLDAIKVIVPIAITLATLFLRTKKA